MSNLASAALALQQAQTQATTPTPTASTPNQPKNKWEIIRDQHRALGKQFNEARRKKYWSQWDVAQATNLSRRTISRVEQYGYAKVDTLISIADALEMELTLTKKSTT